MAFALSGESDGSVSSRARPGGSAQWDRPSLRPNTVLKRWARLNYASLAEIAVTSMLGECPDSCCVGPEISNLLSKPQHLLALGYLTRCRCGP